jgi:Papain-like cysteine protease AvrRpt2
MVLGYRGLFGGQQCQFAEYLFAPDPCCQTPSSKACDKPCNVSQVVQIYNQWKLYGPVHSAQQVPFATGQIPSLESEIRAGRPVEVAWRYSGSHAGHLVLVCGWEQYNQRQFVMIHDPDPKQQQSGLIPVRMDYQDLQTARGSGTWCGTWRGL